MGNTQSKVSLEDHNYDLPLVIDETAQQSPHGDPQPAIVSQGIIYIPLIMDPVENALLLAEAGYCTPPGSDRELGKYY